MLIDKIPALQWEPQRILTEGQYSEQRVMVDQIGLLLKGKYRVVASRFFEMSPHDGIVTFMWPAAREDFHMILGTNLHLHQVFENFTAEPPPTPYLTVWKTQSFHPEYIAVAMLWLGDSPNTLLGYFELEPQ